MTTGGVTRQQSAAPGRAWAITLLLASVSIIATRSASWYIGHAFPDRPRPRDLLLEALPRLGWAEYAADIAVLAAMAALLFYLLYREPDALRPALTISALMYLFRSVLILLTPLANPHGPGYFGIMGSQNGMWPSGHSGNVMLCFLLISASRAPRLRRFVLALAFVEWVTLLLSRGHYSIDIAGGVLLAYFVWSEWTRGTLFAPLKRLVAAD